MSSALLTLMTVDMAVNMNTGNVAIHHQFVTNKGDKVMEMVHTYANRCMYPQRTQRDHDTFKYLACVMLLLVLHQDLGCLIHQCVSVYNGGRPEQGASEMLLRSSNTPEFFGQAPRECAEAWHACALLSVPAYVPREGAQQSWLSAGLYEVPAHAVLFLGVRINHTSRSELPLEGIPVLCS